MNETTTTSPQRVTPAVRQIVIGYAVRALPVTDFTPRVAPVFAPHDEFKESAASRFTSQAPFLPSFGTFDRIELVDMHHKKSMLWTYDAHVEKGKKPAAVRFVQYLINNHPQIWVDDASYRLEFVGFDIAQFLTLVALEASVPLHRMTLPARLWLDPKYGVDFCQLIPHSPEASVVDIVRRRVPSDPSDAVKWAKNTADWNELHQNTRSDIIVATELSIQLGMFDRVR